MNGGPEQLPPEQTPLVGAAITSYQVNVESIVVQPRRHMLYPTTRPECENQLMKNKDRMAAQRDWQITGPLVVVIVLALVTSNFHDLGIPAAEWFGVFFVGAVACALHCAIYWNKSRKNPPLTIEQLADRILKPPDEGA